MDVKTECLPKLRSKGIQTVFDPDIEIAKKEIGVSTKLTKKRDESTNTLSLLPSYENVCLSFLEHLLNDSPALFDSTTPPPSLPAQPKPSFLPEPQISSEVLEPILSSFLQQILRDASSILPQKSRNIETDQINQDEFQSPRRMKHLDFYREQINLPSQIQSENQQLSQISSKPEVTYISEATQSFGIVKIHQNPVPILSIEPSFKPKSQLKQMFSNICDFKPKQKQKPKEIERKDFLFIPPLLKKSQEESIQFPSDTNLKIPVVFRDNSEDIPHKNIESADESDTSEKNIEEERPSKKTKHRKNSKLESYPIIKVDPVKGYPSNQGRIFQMEMLDSQIIDLKPETVFKPVIQIQNEMESEFIEGESTIMEPLNNLTHSQRKRSKLMTLPIALKEKAPEVPLLTNLSEFSYRSVLKDLESSSVQFSSDNGEEDYSDSVFVSEETYFEEDEYSTNSSS